MYSVNIELAGFVCRIESEYRLSVGLYRSFQTDASHDFSITLTANDICIIERAGKSFPGIITEHILQKVTDALIDFNTLLIHGVAIALDKCAYLFAASSGTGKTTHCELWQEKQRDTVFINGDKPFIRFHADGSQPLVCGSPWAGKEDMYTNTMIPLKDIVLMERGRQPYRTDFLCRSLSWPLAAGLPPRRRGKDAQNPAPYAASLPCRHLLALPVQQL